MKRKQFVKGMEQIAQEGAIQIFREVGRRHGRSGGGRRGRAAAGSAGVPPEHRVQRGDPDAAPALRADPLDPERPRQLHPARAGPDQATPKRWRICGATVCCCSPPSGAVRWATDHNPDLKLSEFGKPGVLIPLCQTQTTRPPLIPAGKRGPCFGYVREVFERFSLLRPCTSCRTRYIGRESQPQEHWNHLADSTKCHLHCGCIWRRTHSKSKHSPLGDKREAYPDLCEFNQRHTSIIGKYLSDKSAIIGGAVCHCCLVGPVFAGSMPGEK